MILFALVKSVSYLAPLGVATLISSEFEYGQFEYSLNLGQMLTGVFSAGLVGSYAFYVLKNDKISLKPVFHFHFVFLIAVLILTAVTISSFLTNPIFGAFILGVAFADQVVISGILKSNGRNSFSIIADTSVYIVMSILLCLMYNGFAEFSIRLWHISILISLFLSSVFYHIPRCRGYRDVSFQSIKEIYKFGGLILISGPLIILLSSSTRLFIEYFGSFEDVAAYSLYFRFAGLSLLAFRFIGILMFRGFFLEKHEILDKKYFKIILLILLINLIFATVFTWISSPLFSFLEFNIVPDLKIFILCLFQVVFWINTALFESSMQREQKVKEFILLLIVFVVGLIFTLYTISQLFQLNVLMILVINNVILWLFFYGQQYILRRRQIVYSLTTRVHTGIGILFFISTILIFTL
ncbi:MULTISPECIES: hypothetical protein [Algoriphagus]|jgi:O-antigen/teichoic acid export membrane protein|nr:MULTISPECIES: hypothetical protein [Algoriphagus]|tara:strand:- start:9547 stop:10779 length:1233 start_codon:yes stop_codon:yes gene_type:complete